MSTKKITPMPANAPAPFTATLTVNPKDIADLLASGLEGGTNYWLRIDKMVKPPKGTPVWRSNPDLGGGNYPHLDYPLSGGYLAVTDTEEGKKYRIDRAAIERGLNAMLAKAPQHFADFLAERGDATTGDVFVQCCIFGEIVYG